MFDLNNKTHKFLSIITLSIFVFILSACNQHTGNEIIEIDTSLLEVAPELSVNPYLEGLVTMTFGWDGNISRREIIYNNSNIEIILGSPILEFSDGENWLIFTPHENNNFRFHWLFFWLFKNNNYHEEKIQPHTSIIPQYSVISLTDYYLIYGYFRIRRSIHPSESTNEELQHDLIYEFSVSRLLLNVKN